MDMKMEQNRVVGNFLIKTALIQVFQSKTETDGGNSNT